MKGWPAGDLAYPPDSGTRPTTMVKQLLLSRRACPNARTVQAHEAQDRFGLEQEMLMDMRTIGVAGLGFLGRGIATCLLSHGFQVIAYTRSPSTHAEAREHIATSIQ